jgi:hypothetical protein
MKEKLEELEGAKDEDESESDTESGDLGETEQVQHEGEHSGESEESVSSSGKSEEDPGAETDEKDSKEGRSAQGSGEDPGAEEETGEEIESEEEVIHPPNTWSAKGKGEWAKMSEAAQSEVLKRESDFQNEYTKNQDRIEFASKVERTMQPYMAAITAAGGTPEATIGNLLNTQYRLMNGTPQQVTQMAMQIAKDFGGDLTAFQATIGTQNPEMAALEQRVIQSENQLQQQTQFRQQQEQAELNSVLTAFENEMEEGVLKHPYFSNVQSEMAVQIELIKSTTPGLSHKEILDSAYERAVWANPSTRTQLQTENLGDKERNAANEAKKRVTAAKKKSKTNLDKKAVRDSDKAAPKRTLRESMEQNLEEINSR